MHYPRLVFTLEKLEMFTCQNEKRALIVHQRFKVFLGKVNLVERVRWEEIGRVAPQNRYTGEVLKIVMFLHLLSKTWGLAYFDPKKYSLKSKLTFTALTAKMATKLIIHARNCTEELSVIYTYYEKGTSLSPLHPKAKKTKVFTTKV